ncbi:putative secreted protein [Pseudocercospora fuligena]|uniref:Putative secreted protein n=1 Tax=Pseudocercospora fuligena TaxID=685502 RepID=A0A8H6VST8_9PEZI|nr:putative secreted protein [Pseudocercospora fuligena]
MTTRIISVIAGALAACATIYYLSSNVAYASSQATRKLQAPSNMPPIDDLVVTLSRGKTSDPPTVHVEIQNKNTATPLTLLIWDTPLDPSALNTGVLSIRDASSGETIPGPELKLNRRLPPPREALVTIAPGDVVEKEVELVAPWIPRDGRSVTVKAEGSWRAVWPKREQDVDDEKLAAMSGGGVMAGPFKSLADAQIEL